MTPLQSITLHFDVNKTLIATDVAGGQSLQDVLNGILADKIVSYWSGDPAISPPLSFADYVDQCLVAKDAPNRKQEMRRYTRLFALNAMQHCDPIVAGGVLISYGCMLGKMQNQYIFPSFYKMVKALNTSKIPFNVVIRTFGDDLHDIVQSIESNVPNMKFRSEGKFENGVLKMENQTLNKVDEIFHCFKSNGHMAIRDSYKEWAEAKEAAAHGKKFPVNLSDASHLSLFFDDNVKENDDVSNIVAPVSLKEPLKVSDLIREKRIFKVDTVEAILDDDYYIKCVNQALQKGNWGVKI